MTLQYAYELYEDNGGGIHLAVLDHTGKCVYYLADGDDELIVNTLVDLLDGGDPIYDGWEGSEDDPEKCLESIHNIVGENNGGAWELEAVDLLARYIRKVRK